MCFYVFMGFYMLRQLLICHFILKVALGKRYCSVKVFPRCHTVPKAGIGTLMRSPDPHSTLLSNKAHWILGCVVNRHLSGSSVLKSTFSERDPESLYTCWTGEAFQWPTSETTWLILAE